MVNKIYLALLALILCLNAFSKEPEFDGYIIKFKNNNSSSTTLNTLSANSKIFKTKFGKFATIKRNGLVTKQLKVLESNEEIEYIEPNWIKRAMKFTPSDSSYSEQWGLINLYMPYAWEITKGSNDIIIAVVDTGIDSNHPDLKANIYTNLKELKGKEGVDDDGNGYVDDVNGYNAIDGKNYTLDENNHGTHCAGIIGAVHNTSGIAGVMANVKLMPIKISGSDGSSNDAIMAKGIEYAVLNGAKVISISFGGQGRSETMNSAVKFAESRNVTIVAAAGNDNTNNDQTPAYPASFETSNVIAIGASTQDNKATSFSNYGAKSVHVFAPGSDILSTIPGGGYEKYSGTSMATPFISGVVGLMLTKNAFIKPSEIRKILINTSRSKENFVNRYALGGVVDADDALKAVPNTIFETKIVNERTSNDEMIVNYRVGIPQFRNGSNFTIVPYVKNNPLAPVSLTFNSDGIASGTLNLPAVDPISRYFEETEIRFEAKENDKLIAKQAHNLSRLAIGFDSAVKEVSIANGSLTLKMKSNKANITNVDTSIEVSIKNTVVARKIISEDLEDFEFVITGLDKSKLLNEKLELQLTLKIGDRAFSPRTIETGSLLKVAEAKYNNTYFSNGQLGFKFSFEANDALKSNRITVTMKDSEGKIVGTASDFLSKEFTMEFKTISGAFDPLDYINKHTNDKKFDLEIKVEGTAFKTYTAIVNDTFASLANTLLIYFNSLSINKAFFPQSSSYSDRLNTVISLIAEANLIEIKSYSETNSSIYKDSPSETIVGKLVDLRNSNNDYSTAKPAYQKLGLILMEHKKELPMLKRHAYKGWVEILLK